MNLSKTWAYYRWRAMRVWHFYFPISAASTEALIREIEAAKAALAEKDAAK